MYTIISIESYIAPITKNNDDKMNLSSDWLFYKTHKKIVFELHIYEQEIFQSWNCKQRSHNMTFNMLG